MNIALGMMVRNFCSDEVLTLFLDNAAQYGHSIARVIVVYSHQFSAPAAQRLAQRVPVSFVKLNENTGAREAFGKLGVPEQAARELLHSDLLEKYQLVPYGFNRNSVLIEALLTGMDALIFIDSDVYPYVLRKNDASGAIEKQPFDFFGCHLCGLLDGADITTSDYTGYNILPPANFPHMAELLRGLRKEKMTEFWLDSHAHNSLTLQNDAPLPPYPTNKVLGGNLGIRLKAFPSMPPFFSPYYFHDGTPYIARGEDTLMGLMADQGELRCLDIDLHIFHDTYDTYPAVPDLRRDEAVKKRMFYACAGWIGRNVFFRSRKSGEKALVPPEEVARCLSEGGAALADYTGDERFKTLAAMHRSAMNCRPDMMRQFRRTEEAWNIFMERWCAS